MATDKKSQQGFLNDQGQLTLWSVVGPSQISNSAKLLCMALLRASMKRIWSRTAEKKCQHQVPHFKSMWDIFRRSRAANFAVGGRIWLNFKLLRALLHIIVTCKDEKDWIKTAEKKW